MSNQTWRNQDFLKFTIAYSFIFALNAFLPAACGQTEPAAAPAETNPEVDPKPANDYRFSIAWVSTGGSYVFVPGKWGELHVNVVNSRDQPRELMCATYFDEQPTLQYGRRVWVPPQSTLRISHPVVIPKIDPAKGRGASLHTVVLDASLKDEVFLKNESGQNLHDSAVNLTHSTRNTGVIGTIRGEEDVPSKPVSDLIRACRVSQQLPNGYALMLDTFLPGDASGYDALEHLVITDNRITEDFAALSAVRDWLNGGGHLWVMLDSADPVVLERLLGDEYTGTVFDRVGLTTVRVDKAPNLANPGGAVGEEFEFDEPVQFTRMQVANFTVTHLLNGWPAAMNRSYGEGRILITTLGARGWIKPPPADARPAADPLFHSEFVPTQAMNDIATEFLNLREAELLPQASIEPQMREFVGYTIPSWNLIVGILFAFSALLVATGLGLLRTGHLEHLGWVGTILALAASVLLITIGRAYRHGIPGTVASLQLAQAIPGTDEVGIQGVIGVYHPEGSTETVTVHGGGKVLPDMTGLEGSSRRMVTTDLGVWHWDHLPQPAGLRATSFSQSTTIPDRIEANATFDANGVVGNYSGRVQPGKDPLIATENGRLGVTFNPDGSFIARSDRVFEANQFLAADLISDEQDRHRRTFQNLLANPKRKDYPQRPQLMFWTDEWEHDIQFGSDLQSRGSTLVSVPLILQRPATGTEFVIPSPFLAFYNRTHPDGSPASTMWSSTQKEWQHRAQPGTSWLKVQIPQELLPLEAHRARIDFRVSGPVGRLEVLGLKNNQVVSQRVVTDPVGSVSIEIDDPEVLSVGDDGGLTIGLIAGDASRSATNDETSPNGKKLDRDLKVSYWRIESMALQLWVKATEPTAKD